MWALEVSQWVNLYPHSSLVSDYDYSNNLVKSLLNGDGDDDDDDNHKYPPMPKSPFKEEDDDWNWDTQQ